MLPFIFSSIRNIPLNQTSKLVLVISPLNSLIVDQCTALSRMGLRACALDYECQGATAAPTADDFIDSDADDDDAIEAFSITKTMKTVRMMTMSANNSESLVTVPSIFCVLEYCYCKLPLR